MYGMTISGKLFADDLTEWLLEASFIQYHCRMSIYYKYALDGTKNDVLFYVDDCFYWYTSEAFVKWFVDAIGNILHVNFLGYAHCFMSLRISQMRAHYISVYQDIYATSILDKNLDTAKFNRSTKFYKTTFPYDMVFNKFGAYTSYEKVD